MNKREARRLYIKSQDKFTQFMFSLRIAGLRVKKANAPTGYMYSVRPLNWWNPLSYIAFILFLVAGMLKTIPWVFAEAKEAFTYSK